MHRHPYLPGLKNSFSAHRRGFTLVEILVVIAIISLLATLSFGAFNRVGESSRQAQCDNNLKSLAVALDAFKQEKGHYPIYLRELAEGKYVSTTMLHCPDDPEPQSDGYGDFYIQRPVRNDKRFEKVLPAIGEVPTIMCPFHEESGRGFQAFAGIQTHNFAVKPAILVSTNATSVERPGSGVISGVDGMELHGADRIRTGGSALIRFADGSTCDLSAGSDVTVLQSFVMNNELTLYTVVRQALGDVVYSVHHGSKFDVSTPTATAGALGTEFRIMVSGTYNGEDVASPDYREDWTDISKNETSRVACGTPAINTVITPHVEINVPNDILGKKAKPAKHGKKRGKNNEKN